MGPQRGRDPLLWAYGKTDERHSKSDRKPFEIRSKYKKAIVYVPSVPRVRRFTCPRFQGHADLRTLGSEGTQGRDKKIHRDTNNETWSIYIYICICIFIKGYGLESMIAVFSKILARAPSFTTIGDKFGNGLLDKILFRNTLLLARP